MTWVTFFQLFSDMTYLNDPAQIASENTPALMSLLGPEWCQSFPIYKYSCSFWCSWYKRAELNLRQTDQNFSREDSF